MSYYCKQCGAQAMNEPFDENLCDECFDANADKFGNMFWHFDAGHGWLEIPLNIIDGLKIKISGYSHQQGNRAFFEEDCDAPAVIRALGIEKISQNLLRINDGDSSPIRAMASFNQ